MSQTWDGEGEATVQWYQQVHEIGGPKSSSMRTWSWFSYIPESLVLEFPLSIHALKKKKEIKKSAFIVEYLKKLGKTLKP